MGLLKKHTPFSERVDIWGLGLWMATQTSDPVIQVIYCDEQYVRLRRSLSLPSPQEYETQDGLDNETSLHTA
jgi:hypothetical protein|tara:strand:- start:51 stop:266 length:216 start_codon:yes stop_codon:yes gene_type:complete